MFAILGMMPSTQKCSLRGDNKPSPDSTVSYDKTDTPIDSALISIDFLILWFTKLLDDDFTDHIKNLDKDVDSEAHERVDSTFQLLKIEHDSKLKDAINVTTSKVAESIDNKFNMLHSNVNSTM